MTALCGLGAALVIVSIPVGLVEMLVASSGVSEIIPAAAPPLGLKARLLLAGFAALMAIGITGIMRRDQRVDASQRAGKGRTTGVQGARKMGFAFSKLTALARGRQAALTNRDVPVLRRADAHPDAPARPPIFASRDFNGLDIFARTEPGRRQLVVNPEPQEDPVVSAAGLAMPSAPLPLADADLPAPAPQPAFARPVFASPLVAFTPDPDTVQSDTGQPDTGQPDTAQNVVEPVFDTMIPAPSTQGMSVADLTARLERGLATRTRIDSSAAAKVIADMPVACAIPVREAVAQDVDEALRAALGALRSMTGRAR